MSQSQFTKQLLSGVLTISTLSGGISSYNAYKARNLPVKIRSHLTYMTPLSGFFHGWMWGWVFNVFAVWGYVNTNNDIERCIAEIEERKNNKGPGTWEIPIVVPVIDLPVMGKIYIGPVAKDD